MDWLKKSLLVLILLLVVVFAWVGTSVYFQSTKVDINPNASSYTKSIKSTFDTDELDKVQERTDASFSTSPEEFLNLTNSSN